MVPLLKVAGDGQEHRTSDVADRLAQDFKLTEEQRKQLLPSGEQTTFTNRVAWAKTYLVQAGLL
jgi:restriction system protein